MRYQSKSSIAYMFRNLLHLLYITLPAAALMAFAAYLYKPSAEIDLFVALVTGKIGEDYTQLLLQSFTVLRYGKYWWVFVIAVVALALASAILLAKIDRHMRTGQMSVLPMKRTSAIFPFVLLYVVACIVASELSTLVAVGLSFLIHFIGNASAIVAIVLALMALIRVFTTYVFMLLALTFPLKFSENYLFNRAMSYSARLMFRKKRILWSVAVCYPLLRVIVLSSAYLLAPYKLDILVYAAAFLLAFTYVPCLSYKLYYDDVGGERRDVGRIMFG